MSRFDAKVERIKAAYDVCFGCGRTNPIGLQLDDFAAEGDDAISATFTPRPEYSGFAGVLHGGIVATALDETLAWTAMLLADALVVTAKLELRYRNPALPDHTLRTTGRIVERRGKRLVLAGRLIDGDTLVAEAEGLFLVSGDVPS